MSSSSDPRTRRAGRPGGSPRWLPSLSASKKPQGQAPAAVAAHVHRDDEALLARGVRDAPAARLHEIAGEGLRGRGVGGGRGRPGRPRGPRGRCRRWLPGGAFPPRAGLGCTCWRRAPAWAAGSFEARRRARRASARRRGQGAAGHVPRPPRGAETPATGAATRRRRVTARSRGERLTFSGQASITFPPPTVPGRSPSEWCHGPSSEITEAQVAQNVSPLNIKTKAVAARQRSAELNRFVTPADDARPAQTSTRSASSRTRSGSAR